MATATFITTDTTTQGSWIGVYGADGYEFPISLTSSTPGYLSGFGVTGSGGGAAGTFEFGHDTQVRRLQNPADPTGDRYGICWYDGFWVELALDVGATTRRVAIYFEDDDQTNLRADDITVKEAGSGTLLDSQSVSSFSAGKWLVWDITGSVVIRVTNTTSPNAIVAAVMFDTPGGGGGGGVVGTVFRSPVIRGPLKVYA